MLNSTHDRAPTSRNKERGIEAAAIVVVVAANETKDTERRLVNMLATQPPSTREVRLSQTEAKILGTGRTLGGVDGRGGPTVQRGRERMERGGM